jgi:hypothetical protein
MFAGSLCAACSMFARSRRLLPENAADFVQGLGIGLMVAAFLFLERGIGICRKRRGKPGPASIH